MQTCGSKILSSKFLAILNRALPLPAVLKLGIVYKILYLMRVPKL